MAAILFVMKYPLHRQENLKVKFDGQMAAVRALGHEAYAIGWDSAGMWLIGEEPCLLLRRNLWTGMPGYDHTKIFPDLMAAVRETLRRKRIDLLYLRYMPTFGRAVETMRLLKKQGGKLAVEFPTYPREMENRRSLLRRPVFAYADHVLRRIHPMVDLYTLIGQDGGGALDGRPAMNIINGIQVEHFPQHIPNAHKEGVDLLALASMTAAHGYDRVLRSLAAYRGGKDVRLHMVGAEGDGSLAAWKKLAKELELEERVVFHGALYGSALGEVVAQADVGIGALAMYRFGVFSGTPLKCREYMARGVPFIDAGDDPSIPEDNRFRLRVPSMDAPIDMAEIVAFAEQSRRATDVPGLMRAYAKEHMSWESIMGGVLERLEV